VKLDRVILAAATQESRSNGSLLSKHAIDPQGETMTRTSDRSAKAHRRLLAATGVVALLALAAPLAASADQPILSIDTSTIGGTSSPAPASGSVSSTGQTDLCLADQGATIDPTASTPTDAIQTSAGCSATAATTTSTASTTSNTGPASNGAQSTSATRLPATQTAASVVEALDASRLEIAAVRFITKHVRAKKKLGLLITLRGQQNKLIQRGIVAINTIPTAKITCLCQRATFTNQLGRAAFTIPVTKSMRAKRLFFRITALTPTIKTIKLVSVRLP
jgi:hypothetical protein